MLHACARNYAREVCERDRLSSQYRILRLSDSAVCKRNTYVAILPLSPACRQAGTAEYLLLKSMSQNRRCPIEEQVRVYLMAAKIPNGATADIHRLAVNLNFLEMCGCICDRCHSVARHRGSQIMPDNHSDANEAGLALTLCEQMIISLTRMLEEFRL